MKIRIDTKPKTEGQQESVYIRLYPENNQEISELEWAFGVFQQPERNNLGEPYAKAEVIRVATTGNFHHAICYQRPT